MSELLSLVVPCFNEEAALPPFYEEASRVLVSMDIEAEFIFIDDGSKDKTLEILRSLAIKDPRVHYVSFSRNFGKESAMFAGLEHAKGDYVATLDADLQDPPSLLPEMLQALKEEKYDCTGTRRVTRKGEPPIRSFFARRFYSIMRKLSNIEVVDGARDYRLMTRQFVKAVLSLGEVNRFSKGIFPWVGFKTKWFEYENIERVAGETKWSFWKLFVYSLDGMTAFSTKPLAIASGVGMLIAVLSVFLIILIIVRKILYGDPVAGWASTICIILLTSGLQLMAIGILGQYMAKTYLESKQRPIYIAKEKR